jgi:hypothetical protein
MKIAFLFSGHVSFSRMNLPNKFVGLSDPSRVLRYPEDPDGMPGGPGLFRKYDEMEQAYTRWTGSLFEFLILYILCIPVKSSHCRRASRGSCATSGTSELGLWGLFWLDRVNTKSSRVYCGAAALTECFRPSLCEGFFPKIPDLCQKTINTILSLSVPGRAGMWRPFGQRSWE